MDTKEWNKWIQLFEEINGRKPESGWELMCWGASYQEEMRKWKYIPGIL